MKLDFNLQISQRQGLALTSQVQQAIKLLQMTNLELSEFVEQQFQDNPFVEETSLTEKLSPASSDKMSKIEIDKSLEATPYKNANEQDKLSSDNQFETGEAYTPRSTVAKEVSDFDPINLVAENSKSLFTHCIEYCGNLEFNVTEKLVAFKLIEELEPTGWIANDLEIFATELKVGTDFVEAVL